MIDLKNFSKYSKEYGFLQIDDILKSDSTNENRIAFLTDHSTMYASHSFINEAVKNGIKPVIGLTINVFDESSKNPKVLRELTLYAKNKIGFSDLTNLTHLSSIDTYGEKSYSINDVLNLSDNVAIMLSSGSLTGLDIDDVAFARKLNEKNGDDIYFGFPPKSNDVKNSESEDNLISIHKLKTIARFIKVDESRFLAVNNNRFLTPSSHKYVRVKSEKVVPAGRKFDSSIIKSVDFIGNSEYNKKIRFPDSDPFNEMIVSNNNNFAKMFEKYELKVNEIYIPKFNNSLKDVLRERYSEFINNKIAESGFVEKSDISKFRASYDSRIVEEITLIEKLGFSDYFLIFEDFARNNPERNFVLRGSAISSLTTHILGLSKIDPVENGLLFERFLNENRLKNLELPDVDVETDDVKEIVKYMQNKYGYDNFVSLATDSSMRAKSQLDNAFETVRRDIIETPFKNGENRVMPNQEYIKMVDLIKSNFNSDKNTFAEELEENDDLKKFVNSSRNASVLANLALIYENQVTAIQRVPASFAISKTPIDRLYSGFESVDKKDGFKYKTVELSALNIEDLGFVKIDILSNKYLSKIIEMKKKYNINIDLKNQDPNVYEMINRGYTSTLNQIKSNTQSRLVKNVGVSNLNDIVNIIALIRPAVEQSKRIEFQNKKNGTYVGDKNIGHIVDASYGIIIFDEQVMKIAQDFGGFTPAESDDFRGALKNNQKVKLDLFYEKMTSNAKKNGLSGDEINKVIGMLNDTAGKYTFSKAHSIAYAQLIYEQAYLKENYPAEYMSVFINSPDTKKAERVEYIKELNSRGVTILKVNVNRSDADFKTRTQNGKKFIDYPITMKNKEFGEKLVEDRGENGEFKDIFDLMERMVSKYSEKPIIEMNEKEITNIKISIISGINELTSSGALDSLVNDNVLNSIYNKLPPNAKRLNSMQNNRNEIARTVIDVTVSKNLGKLLNPFDYSDFEYSEIKDVQKSNNLIEYERIYYGSNIDFIKVKPNFKKIDYVKNNM